MRQSGDSLGDQQLLYKVRLRDSCNVISAAAEIKVPSPAPASFPKEFGFTNRKNTCDCGDKRALTGLLHEATQSSWVLKQLQRKEN